LSTVFETKKATHWSRTILHSLHAPKTPEIRHWRWSLNNNHRTTVKWEEKLSRASFLGLWKLQFNIL